MIQEKSVNQAQGFTMLEIVTVLVLLGIISAVAVPKYFDMQGEAEKKAAKAALAEAQVRINAGYSKAVYAGKSCEEAVAKVNTIKKIADKQKDGDDYVISQFKVISPSEDTEFSVNGTPVTIQLIGGAQTYLGTLTVPSCESESGSSGDSGLVCPDSTDQIVKCESKSIVCNGTVTCSCSDSGDMTCVCAGSSTDEVDDKVKPSYDKFVKIEKFNWVDRKSYIWGVKLGMGTVIKDGDRYYVLAADGYFSANDYRDNIEDTVYYAKDCNELNGGGRFVIKLDISNSNWVFYDSNGGTRPWVIFEAGEWRNASGAKFGNIIEWEGNFYVLKERATTETPTSSEGAKVWVKLTEVKIMH